MMEDAAAITFLDGHRRTIAYAINGMRVPERHRDDVRQEVAYKIIRRFRNLGPLPVEGNSGYALQVTRGACLDLFRRRGHHLGLIEAEQVERMVDGSPLPDAIADGKLRAEVLDRAIACLTPLKRHVVREVMAGRSMVEVADALGRTHGSVKVLHHRAVIELKKLLTGK